MANGLPAGFELDTSFKPTAAPDVAPAGAPAQATSQQAEGPPPADSMLVDAGKSLYTALHSAADTGTFGLADKASAAIGSAISPMTGQPLSYDEAYARIKANASKLAGQHPVAAAVGDVGGMVAGAGGLLKAAKLIPGAGAVVDALAPVAGSPLKNIAKSAATAGVASGGYTAADDLVRNGEVNPSNIAVNTAIGAAVGPAVSKVGTLLARGVRSDSTKAMALLASKIDESPATLQRAYDNFIAATGRVPTMAELVEMKSKGELAQLVANNPIVRTAANTAEDVANSQRPQALSAVVESNSGGHAVQDVSQLTQARAQRMTDSMNQIRGNRVLVGENDAGILADPRVRAAVRSTKDPVLADRLGSVLDEIGDNGHSDLLTVDDMDSIRKAVRSQQTNFSNPQHPQHNVQAARSMGNLADNLADIVTGGDSAHPYQRALDQFGSDSDYINAFKHGLAGKTVGEATEPSLQAALASAEGTAGHQAGIVSRVANSAADGPQSAVKTASDLAHGGGDTNLLRTAVGEQNLQATQRAAAAESKGAANLKAVAGDIKPDSTDHLAQAGQLAGAAGAHSPSGIAFHLSRLIPSFKTQSPAVQKQISRYLLDPSMTQQGINLLRRAGAKDADLRKLAVALSANAGLNTADTLGQ